MAAPPPPADPLATPPPHEVELHTAVAESSPSSPQSQVAAPASAAAPEHPTQPSVPEPEPEQRRAVLAPLPLDWTRLNECNDTIPPPANSIIRYPWDVADIDITDTYLTLVGTAGQKITRMGHNLHEHVNPNLTHLVLRSHLIRTMEGIRNMEHLELLELYDNMIDELRELDVRRADADGVAAGVGEVAGEGEEDGDVAKSSEETIELLPRNELKVLDISYNAIRDMGPISLCPNLQELYIAQNKIKNIKGLRHLTLLRKIDLGANRIRTIDEEEMSGLENLEELWLGKNKIEHISGISKLTKLRKLDLQSNRLTRIENLHGQVDTLEELYLSHNAIDVEGAKVETGLALPFTQLSTIDMSRNRLTDTSPFAHLTSLNDLWISGNDIKSFDDIEPIRGLTQLDSLYLEYNPVDKDFEYRMKLAKMIPSLTQIDANKIGGLGQHGYMSSQQSLVERMRQIQDTVIEKAKMEVQQKEEGEDDGAENAKMEVQKEVGEDDGAC